MQPARRLATFDDLLALSEGVRAEVVDGSIVVSPPPLPEHGRAQGSLSRFLGGPFDYDDGRGGPGGWWILVEVEIELSRHGVYRPDLSGWRRERLLEPWGKRPVRVVPDWVCEIVSPSNPRHDRVLKRRVYAEHGVPYYWILDPQQRTLEALRLDVEVNAWVEIGVYDEASTARIAPFEAVELEVGRLFSPASSGE